MEETITVTVKATGLQAREVTLEEDKQTVAYAIAAAGLGDDRWTIILNGDPSSTYAEVEDGDLVILTNRVKGAM